MCRQTSLQLAEDLRADGLAMLQQALKQHLFDPEQCCELHLRKVIIAALGLSSAWAMLT